MIEFCITAQAEFKKRLTRTFNNLFYTTVSFSEAGQSFANLKTSNSAKRIPKQYPKIRDVHQFLLWSCIQPQPSPLMFAQSAWFSSSFMTKRIIYLIVLQIPFTVVARIHVAIVVRGSRMAKQVDTTSHTLCLLWV